MQFIHPPPIYNNPEPGAWVAAASSPSLNNEAKHITSLEHSGLPGDRDDVWGVEDPGDDYCEFGSGR